MYVETSELRRHNLKLSDLGDQRALLEHQRLVEVVDTLRNFELPFDKLVSLIARVDRLLAETKRSEEHTSELQSH